MHTNTAAMTHAPKSLLACCVPELPADTAAGFIWSLYASALGYFGGAAFENNLWAPLLIATGASLIVAGAGEYVRRRGLRRRARAEDSAS